MATEIQSQEWKHQHNLQNLFKVNDKDTKTMSRNVQSQRQKTTRAKEN